MIKVAGGRRRKRGTGLCDERQGHVKKTDRGRLSMGEQRKSGGWYPMDSGKNSGGGGVRRK